MRRHGSDKIVLLLRPQGLHFFVEQVGLEKYLNPYWHSNSTVLRKLKRVICGIEEKDGEKGRESKENSDKITIYTSEDGSLA